MKPAILLVDDEPKTLKNFSRFYGKEYRVYVAESAQQATEELYTHPGEIGVVICDERMPLIRGIDFLARLAKEQPQIVQILTTAYTDVDVLQHPIAVGLVFGLGFGTLLILLMVPVLLYRIGRGKAWLAGVMDREMRGRDPEMVDV